MKKYLLLLILFCNLGVYAQIGIGTTSPNASAALHVESTTQGVLIPRMTSAEKGDITVGAAQKGLLVYQTDSTPGFYYYTGSAWTTFGGASSAWTLTGNGGTNPGANYLGTDDTEDFVFTTDNNEVMRMTSGGNVGIGTAASSALFHFVDTPASPTTIVDQDFESLAGSITTTTSVDPHNVRTVFTGCTAGSDWKVEAGDASTGTTCAACTGQSALIDFESGCTQDVSLIVGPFTATATSIQISFDYAYQLYSGSPAASDLFEATLVNIDTPSTVTLVTHTNDIDDGNHLSIQSVTLGEQYELRFQYKGDYEYGAQLDNVLVVESLVSLPALRIDDGNQVNGHILTSDANGVATWQVPSAGSGSDSDWLFDSGTGDPDPIYHQGDVSVGSNPASGYALHIANGNSFGSTISIGSVEYFEDDGANRLIFEYSLVPETNGVQAAGSTSARWANIWYSFLDVSSDINLKENIQPLKYGLDDLLKLNSISYKWKKELVHDFVVPRKHKKTTYGFSAQELQKVLPEVVKAFQWKESEEVPGTLIKVEGDRLAVTYTEVIPVAVKAIQEQQEQIIKLEKEIVEIERLIKRYEKK